MVFNENVCGKLQPNTCLSDKPLSMTIPPASHTPTSENMLPQSSFCQVQPNTCLSDKPLSTTTPPASYTPTSENPLLQSYFCQVNMSLMTNHY